MQSTEKYDILETALAFAAEGFPVFPCHADGELAKRPLTSNGFKGATCNERIIRIWWGERHADALIGLPTGKPINAWVLDVDRKSGGYETLAALEAEHGSLPRTRTVSTASGGKHFYWRHVEGVTTSARKLNGHGIDVRGDGGFVIAPGSVMADGRTYTLVEDMPVADAPDWLLDIVLPPPYVVSTVVGRTVAAGENRAYCQAAINRELAAVASAQPGSRSYQLNRSAYAIGQFVGAGAISHEEAREALEAIARQWPNLPKSQATIRRGLRDGAARPRPIPASSARHNADTGRSDCPANRKGAK